jgi:hypothetical protein
MWMTLRYSFGQLETIAKRNRITSRRDPRDVRRSISYSSPQEAVSPVKWSGRSRRQSALTVKLHLMRELIADNPLPCGGSVHRADPGEHRKASRSNVVSIWSGIRILVHRFARRWSEGSSAEPRGAQRSEEPPSSKLGNLPLQPVRRAGEGGRKLAVSIQALRARTTPAYVALTMCEPPRLICQNFRSTRSSPWPPRTRHAGLSARHGSANASPF